MSPDPRIAGLLDGIDKDVEAIRKLLDPATAAQWLRSKPRKSELIVTGSDRPVHSDPTGDAAIDARRMRLRTAMRQAERHLLQAAARIKGTRAAIERGVDSWDGEG